MSKQVITIGNHSYQWDFSGPQEVLGWANPVCPLLIQTSHRVVRFHCHHKEWANPGRKRAFERPHVRHVIESGLLGCELVDWKVVKI